MKLLGLISGSNNNRGVSPVIGVIFMVAAVVIVAASIGVTVMDAADGVSDPAPKVKFDVEPTDDGVEITHTSGDSIDGDQIKLSGDAATETIPEWSGETVSVGDTAKVDTYDGELEIIWESESGTDTTRLTSKEVPKTVTPTAEIDKITSGYFSEDYITVYMGEVSDAPDDNVYVVVENGGEKSFSSGGTKDIAKDPSQSGMWQSHTLKLYETSSQERKLGECTINRNGEQYYDEWNSPCS